METSEIIRKKQEERRANILKGFTNLKTPNFDIIEKSEESFEIENDDIEKGKDLKKAFDDDIIEKSHIISAFKNNNNILVEKTGEEIKEKLEKVKIKESTEATENLKELKELLLEINIQPEEEASYWDVEGIIEKENLPKLYSWNQRGRDMESPKNSMDTPIETPINVEKDIYKKMCDYNKYADKYFDNKREIALIETLISNLTDKDKYKLTISQLESLES